jgi:hypothetical protein
MDREIAAGMRFATSARPYPSNSSTLPSIRFDEWLPPPSPWKVDTAWISRIGDGGSPQGWHVELVGDSAILYGYKKRTKMAST